MSHIVRAKVLSNSSEDKYCRVRLQSAGIWDESELVESIGGISLKEGDYVFVDVSSGYENPLIIGRALQVTNYFHREVNGSVLFESSDGDRFTLAFVKNNKLEIYNSENVGIIVDGSGIVIKSADIKLSGGTLEVKASKDVAPDSVNKGGFCAIPKCLFSGAVHTGTKIEVLED